MIQSIPQNQEEELTAVDSLSYSRSRVLAKRDYGVTCGSLFSGWRNTEGSNSTWKQEPMNFNVDSVNWLATLGSLLLSLGYLIYKMGRAKCPLGPHLQSQLLEGVGRH